MAMIKSGNVVIPTTNRPSAFGGAAQPRNTIGGRFRASIAAQEPRTSLFPLGINILNANVAQREMVNDWLKEKCEAATPASKKIDPLKSHQKLRFESPGKKSDEVKNDSSVVSTPYVTKSFLPPTALKSALKGHRNVELATAPMPTARKLNFDDSAVDKSIESTETVSNENEMSNENVFQEFSRAFQNLIKIDRNISPEERRKINEWTEKLTSFRNQLEKDNNSTPQIAKSILGPISESECDEEEENEEVVARFGSLKVRGSPRRLLKPFDEEIY